MLDEIFCHRVQDSHFILMYKTHTLILYILFVLYVRIIRALYCTVLYISTLIFME